MHSTATVSVIVPCRNEIQHLEKLLQSIICSDYPKQHLEIFIVDGMSYDGTRELIESYAKDYSFIKLVDNPKKITPCAMNIGIRKAKGNVILLMGAHATYPDDYISKCVYHLYKNGADNVGGVLVTMPGKDTLIARAIAYTLASTFGIGIVPFRAGSSGVQEVDTVFGGCYRREVFERIGLFDEALIKGQDREFNERLRRSGGKILLVPDIVCSYFARTSLKDFMPWIFVSGLTPFYISKITRRIVFSWRNLVPVFAVLGLLLLLSLSLAMPVFWWVTGSVVLCYLVLCLYFSAPIAQREGDIRFMFVMPLIFAVTHALYGIGSLVGMFKRIDRHAEWSKI